MFLKRTHKISEQYKYKLHTMLPQIKVLFHFLLSHMQISDWNWMVWIRFLLIRFHVDAKRLQIIQVMSFTNHWASMIFQCYFMRLLLNSHGTLRASVKPFWDFWGSQWVSDWIFIKIKRRSFLHETNSMCQDEDFIISF